MLLIWSMVINLCLLSSTIVSNQLKSYLKQNYRKIFTAIKSSIDIIPNSNKPSLMISCFESCQFMKENAKYPAPPALHEDLYYKWIFETSNKRLLTDLEFKDLINVREIKRKYRNELIEIEQTLQDSKFKLENTESGMLMIQLERETKVGLLTIENMKKFTETEEESNLSNASDITTSSNAPNASSTSKGIKSLINRQEKVRIHLPAKIIEIHEKIEKLNQLHQDSIEYQNYIDAIKKKEEFLNLIGLYGAINKVNQSQNLAGRGRNTRGKSFEDISSEIVINELIPKLAKKFNYHEKDLFIVRNTKFAMASSKGTASELDCLVCVEGPRPSRLDSIKNKGIFCMVLGVIEMKRNPDDIGEAFVGYQRTLAWLSGLKETYSAKMWKTRNYVQGHFEERIFVAERGDGTMLLFSPESFVKLNHLALHYFQDKEDQDHGDHEEMEGVVSTSSSAPAAAAVMKPSPQYSEVIYRLLESLKMENEVEEEEVEDSIHDLNALDSTTIDPLEDTIQPQIEDSVKYTELECGSTVPTLKVSIPYVCDSSNPIISNLELSEMKAALFVEDLYFVTRDSCIENISSKASSWSMNKIASEIDFDIELSDRGKVENLRNRLLKKFPHRLSTIELIQLYDELNVPAQIFLVRQE